MSPTLPLLVSLSLSVSQTLPLFYASPSLSLFHSCLLVPSVELDIHSDHIKTISEAVQHYTSPELLTDVIDTASGHARKQNTISLLPTCLGQKHSFKCLSCSVSFNFRQCPTTPIVSHLLSHSLSLCTPIHSLTTLHVLVLHLKRFVYQQDDGKAVSQRTRGNPQFDPTPDL